MAEITRKPATSGSVITNTDGLRVVFDATLTDDRGQTMEVTKDPIEDASTVSSHIIDAPGTFSLTGIITRTPLFEESSPTRLEDIIEDLFKLIDAKRLVTIVNGLHVLAGYVITNLNIARPEDIGQAVNVSMSFEELVIVSPVKAKLPPIEVAADKRASATSTGDAGTQSPTDSEGESTKSEVSASIAASGFDFLRGVG